MGGLRDAAAASALQVWFLFWRKGTADVRWRLPGVNANATRCGTLQLRHARIVFRQTPCELRAMVRQLLINCTILDGHHASSCLPTRYKLEALNHQVSFTKLWIGESVSRHGLWL
jgi:hypothetical protein